MNTAIPYFKNLEKISNAIIVMGILLGTLGIIAIGYPEIAGKTTVAVLGIFLVFGAILRGTFAIFSFSMGRMILQYILAILMMITGLWLLTNQAAGLQTVTIVLGVFFIVDGGTSIVYSFSLKPIGGGAGYFSMVLLASWLGFLFGSSGSNPDHIFLAFM
jgi:uncharacterized membrane protein HdeD (DUF308 family)